MVAQDWRIQIYIELLRNVFCTVQMYCSRGRRHMSPKKARRAFEHKTATDECASNTGGATEACDYATSVQIRRQDGWQDEPGSLLAGVPPHAFKDSLNGSSAFVGPIRRDLASCPSTGLLDRSRVVLAGPCSQRVLTAIFDAFFVDQSPSPILRHVIGRRSFRRSLRRPIAVAQLGVHSNRDCVSPVPSMGWFHAIAANLLTCLWVSLP